MPSLIRYTKKSILIFSHKEYLQYFRIPKWSVLHLLAEPHRVIFHFIRSFIVRHRILKLSNQANLSIGVHWGFLVKRTIEDKFVDVHLADSFQSEYIKTDGCVVGGFQSASFAGFTPLADKPFDMITVSHNSTRKKLDSIFDEFVLIAEADPTFTCCMVVNTPSKRFRRNSRETSIEFIRRYNSLPIHIRDRISLCRISDELGPLGVPKIFIMKLMRDSRIFVLASEREGNAKVVSEAYSNGCYCVGSSRLEGDTFANVPDSSKCLLDGISQNLSSWYLDSIVSGSVTEKIELPNHAWEFQKMLRSRGLIAGSLETEDDLNWLDKKLPSLYPTSVSDYVSNKVTGTYDLNTIADWIKFNV